MILELLLSMNFAIIKPIIEKRCSQCHNANWAEKNWLDEKIFIANKAKILNRVVVLKDMPPANATGMTEEERKIIKEYLK